MVTVLSPLQREVFWARQFVAFTVGCRCPPAAGDRCAVRVAPRLHGRQH